MLNFKSVTLVLLLVSPSLWAAKIVVHDRMMDHGGGHLMDMGGAMVMGQNLDRVPDGCGTISGTKEITVRAGHKHAKRFPGRMFAFDQQEFNFEPCTKLTVNFINEDKIRHQFMIHGLPRYLYAKGMFHLEVTGPGQVTGTLILPPAKKTYLVHCDIAQHMEKGMKGQMKVGGGDVDLPSIPGVTPYVVQDSYKRTVPLYVPPVDPSVAAKKKNAPYFTVSMIAGLVIGLLLLVALASYLKGKQITEIFASLFGCTVALGSKGVSFFKSIFVRLFDKTKKLSFKK
jgi:hypothetical protein